MTQSDETGNWARRFGLAAAPLFEREAVPLPGHHAVLLDGSYGSFALSVCDGEIWRDRAPANWAWSSDIPHHVTVTPTKVAVLRWDRPDDYRVWQRDSVERSLERFYGFLMEDRLRSNRGVVDHLLAFFRRLRSLGHAAGLPDARATDLFTANLLNPNEGLVQPELYGLAADARDLLKRVETRGLSAAVEEIERGTGTLSWLRLFPSLAIRHAGGQLFQEAHFELLRGAADLDLFGLVGAPEVATNSRGGTHFTPPTLARSLVERVLDGLGDFARRRQLTLCDPACGSGAFLHEALRTLRRVGFRGRLRLVGYDISPAAIAMARFAVATSLRDWTPDGGVELDLRQGDSLGELGMPAADIIVMNPPFIGFAVQTPIQRMQLRAALGASSAGRGDYSMAFVLRALEALRPGGVLGTLFPASLLSLKAASSWRERLLDLADVRFLASIGEFGLFSQAMVQVAAAIFSEGSTPGRELLAVVTENDPQATSAALRQIRRSATDGMHPALVEDTWSIFPVPVESLRRRPTWRLPTPRAERVLRALANSGLPTVGDLFDVAQGIQTGLNEAFLLTEDEIKSLPVKERRFFRQATMTDSIQNGRVAKRYWLFFPYGPDRQALPNEAALRRAVPKYFERFLQPNRARLEARASIVRSRRSDWWGLMHAREWSLSGEPRIITKFFGAEGAFVGDYNAAFFVVMGHVWTLKPRQTADAIKSDATIEQLSEKELLAAFVALCNSEVFSRFLGIYSPYVAGGQFDLSARHVAPIPMPDLQILSLDLEIGRAVRRLVTLGAQIEITSTEWRRETLAVVELLYGGIDVNSI
jgi:adenine-specific DNA-methyltransferase